MELPVIVSDIPGPNEAMKDGYSGLLVPKQDTAALAQAMERLNSDRALCRSLGENGRRYVTERYEQQEFYRHTLQNRQSLLDAAHKPKRICFVTTVSMTLNSFVVKLAEYLHAHSDYDITFICNPDEKFQASLPDYIHFHPIPMERGISLGGLGAMLKMRKIFRKEKFDLVQYSTPNASFYASLAGWLAGVPVRLYCQWGIAYVGFCGIKRKIFKFIEKTVCRLSTWIEPDSHGNLDFSHAEGLYPAEKGSVNWNGSASGVDLCKFDRSQKALWRQQKRRELGIPDDAFVYCFVGRITGDKGINELLTAFRTLSGHNPRVWLMMVGNPEKTDSVDPALYDWAQTHKQVLFAGYTNVVEQYLAASDVYVLPSYREGFGSAVIEAEAMALPVIITDIPGPTNAMVRDETGLVVPKKDAEALHDAMKTLAEDPALCARFSESGYRFASEKFEQNELFRRILIDRKNLLNDR
jgi:glycosyltransferase involved in cell wall biosynthesis